VLARRFRRADDLYASVTSCDQCDQCILSLVAVGVNANRDALAGPINGELELPFGGGRLDLCADTFVVHQAASQHGLRDLSAPIGLDHFPVVLF